MATLDGLENSLHQYDNLSREVLERAHRRKTDRSELPRTCTPMTVDRGALYRQKLLAEVQEELDDAFSAITEFMAKTHSRCKGFYNSTGCSLDSALEKKHVARYHNKCSEAFSAHVVRHHPRREALHFRQQRHLGEGISESMGWSQDGPVDFYAEVAPGLYTISASRPGSREQSQTFDLDAGQSCTVTFDL